MRLLFLDIDGVLAPIKFGVNTPNVCFDIVDGGVVMFDNACVAELNYICNAAKASIVVSSSWRLYIRDLEKMRAVLRAQGVSAPVVGMTPVRDNRGQEVKAFLDGLDAESFIVIDDRDDGFDEFRHRFVKTRTDVGLTARGARLALKLFGVAPNRAAPGA